MRLFRADIPDTRVLRGHHRQTRFDGVGIILIGNVHCIEGMFYRNADHGIRQPFNVVHIAGNRRITEVEIQHMGQFVKVAFIDAFITQQGQIAKNRCYHFIAVREAFIGEGCRDS
ncbi:hypothetical protein D3C86_1383990 [compost metagenome]